MDKLKYWCQKVLPLVYDDSLSYYELLCKILNYINELIETDKNIINDIDNLRKEYEELKNYVDNYFNNLDVQEEINNVFDGYVSSGKINELLRNALVSDLVDESYYDAYAQVLYTENRIWDYNKYQQGFAIGEIDGRPVCCNCFTDSSATGKTNVIVFTYLDSGVNIGRFTIQSGHCNSCTFNEKTGNFMIACGGGTSTYYKILEVGIDGTIKHTYSYEQSPWAITYNKEKIYVTFPSGVLKVFNASDMSIIETHNIILNTNYTHQGMFSDDLYLYYPIGNTIKLSTSKNRNMIMVYYHDGTFYKSINVYYPLEIEECSIYKGICYMASTTQGVGFILTTDLYRNNASGTLGRPPLSPNNNNNVWDMYINEDYNGFFMNGTSSYPYSSLLWWDFLMPNSVTSLRINALSDVLKHPLSCFSSANCDVRYVGNNHKLLRVNMNGNHQVILEDVTIVGETNTTFVYIEGYHTYLNNVTIGESGGSIICNRALNILGEYEIASMTINCSTNGSNPLLYLVGNGYIRNFTLNSTTVGYTFLGGVYDVDSTFPLSKLNLTNHYGLTYKPHLTLTKDLDLSTLIFPCALSVMVNTVHISNAPSGFDDTNINAIVCEYISTNKSLVTVIKTDGTIHQQYNHW